MVYIDYVGTFCNPSLATTLNKDMIRRMDSTASMILRPTDPRESKDPWATRAMNPHQGGMSSSVIHSDPQEGTAFHPNQKTRFGLMNWPTFSVPEPWIRSANQILNGVIVPSQQQKSILEKSGCKVPLLLIPPRLPALFFDQHDPIELSNIKEGDKVFVVTCDWTTRSNIFDLITAFSYAFHSKPDTYLVLNILPPNDRKAVTESIRKHRSMMVGLGPTNIYTIVESLPDEVLAKLYTRATAYVSVENGCNTNPYLLRALALGTPTIGVGWVDFGSDNMMTYAVGYDKMPCYGDPQPGLSTTQLWARPSIKDIVYQMNSAIEDLGKDTTIQYRTGIKNLTKKLYGSEDPKDLQEVIKASEISRP